MSTRENKVRFCEINEKVPTDPGIYEIWTDKGICLKVGIGKDIRKRLVQHAASRQSGLKLKPNLYEKDRLNPSNVLSKSSILAKHLYYDHSLASDCKLDLKLESARQEFLLNSCYVIFEITETKDEARQLECYREQNEQIRYVGLVEIR